MSRFFGVVVALSLLFGTCTGMAQYASTGCFHIVTFSGEFCGKDGKVAALVLAPLAIIGAILMLRAEFAVGTNSRSSRKARKS